MRLLSVLTLLPLLARFAAADTKISAAAVAADIKEVELMKNLKALARIAERNGGNRAFGLPGYRASVEYVLERARRFKRTVDVVEQEFEALFSIVDEIELRVVGEEPIYVFGLTYSPSTAPEGVTAPLVLGPEGAAGCDVAGYEGIDVKDKIVLVQRFRCPDQTTLAGRIRPAVKAGAAAVIIYHDLPTKPTAGTLTSPDPVGYRPAGFIHLADGEKWKARLQAGEELTAYFKQLQTIENRKTWNVIAETKGGDPDAVIVMGAHLDSVQAGPGINDDGSGTSLVLELLSSAKKYSTDLKLRFCFWGAEENGLFGSEHYVNTLPEEELAKIRAYLNFDMVSRGYYGVFDGDGSTHGLVAPKGSETLETMFSEYLSKTQGVPITAAAFTGGSDYAPFMEKGIPIGGLHTGTGFEQDPCYHQECDGYANANSTVLTKNAKAAGYVMAKLAIDGKKLIPKWSSGEMGMMRIASQGIEWTLEEGARHTGQCGHDNE